MNSEGQPLHVRLTSRTTTSRRPLGSRRGLALHPGRQDRAPAARAAHPRSRGPLHQPRGTRRDEAVRTAASSSTSPGSARSCPMPWSTSSASCRACITSSSSWPTSTSPRRPMEVGPTTHYIMGGIRVDGDTRNRPCRGCSPPASAPPAFTAPTGSAATRSPISSCSASVQAIMRPRSPEIRPAARLTSTPTNAPCSRRWRPSSAVGPGENPYAVQHELQTMMQALVGIVRTEAEMVERRCRGWSDCSERASRVGVSRPPRVQPGLAHRPRPAQPARPSPRRSRGRRSSGRRAAAATSARTIPTSRRSTARSTSPPAGWPTARCRWRGCRCRRCRRSWRRSSRSRSE